MDLLTVLLYGTPEGTTKTPFQQLLPLILIIAVFYFFMIRPQTRKQKELRSFRDALKKGDKIITSGGIYGKIVEIAETTVIIEVEDKSRIKVDKAVIIRDTSDLPPQK